MKFSENRHDLNSSRNILQLINNVRVRLVGRVAQVRTMRHSGSNFRLGGNLLWLRCFRKFLQSLHANTVTAAKNMSTLLYPS